MNAEELLRSGDLAGALSALQDQVRGDPASAKHRVFLFQLLAVMGQWDRALTQLNVAGELDPASLGMVAMYREVLVSEALRKEVFEGTRSPLVLGEPLPWVAMMLEALRIECEGSYEQAAELRGTALADAPATAGSISAGSIDGEEFEWLADADSRLGPILEVITNGRYYWAPLARIKEIRFDPPEDLRDLIWLPAEFVWANGGEAVGLVPTRYPFSEASADTALQLARKTEWTEQDGDSFHGLGQRLLATDRSDFSLLETREIKLNTGDI